MSEEISEATVAPDSGSSQSAPPTVPSVRERLRTLRKKMSAVLETHARLGESESTVSLAGQGLIAAREELNALPGGEAPLQVENQLARATRRLRDARDYHEQHVHAVLRCEQAKQAFFAAVEELVAQFASLDEESVAEADSSLVEAARHLACAAQAKAAGLPQANVLAAQVAVAAFEAEGEADCELDQKQLDELERLRVTLIESARLCARANTLARQLAETAKECASHDEAPAVQEPVRPTVEEVQRYLGQLESYMIKRQEAHQAAAGLGDKATNLIEELNAAARRLQETAAATFAGNVDELPADLHTSEQVVALMLCAKGQQGTIAAARQRLSDARIDCEGFDTLKQPEVPSKEKRYIEELRQGLEEVAYAMGRLNEAKLALEGATADGQLPLPQLHDRVLDCRTWAECLELRQQWFSDYQDTERENVSRQARIDLLGDSVEAATNEKTQRQRSLRRLVVSIRPESSASKQPCDELRRVLNMSACAHGKRGDFPMY